MIAASSLPPNHSYSSDALFANQSGRNLGLKNPDYSGRWNWGAFFFSGLWMMQHGKVRRGCALLLLDCIPLVGLLAHVYCGIHGNDIAYDSRRFESIDHFATVQRAWRNWAFCATLLGFAAATCTLIAHQPRTANLTREAVHRGATGVPTLALAHIGARATGHVPTRAVAGVTLRTTPFVAPRRKPIASTVIAVSAHPCEAALESVDAAMSATREPVRYAASVSALRFSRTCRDTSIAMRTQALALSQKAIAEHDGHLGNWHKDISDSIALSLRCAQAAVDADGRNGADCSAIADHERQVALLWREAEN